jgi:hypothetical protein
MTKPVDYRGIAGTMLRGKNVYPGGTTSPNPSGNNQWKNSAEIVLRRRKIAARKKAMKL